MGTPKEWAMTLDGYFYVITGVSFLDTAASLLAVSFSEIFTINSVGHIVVSVTALCFWLLRRKLAKSKAKKENELLELEIEIKKRQLDECSNNSRTHEIK